MPIRTMRLLGLFIVYALCQPSIVGAAEKTKDERSVKDGMLVSVDFTVKTPDGKVLETSKDKEPLKYIHGKKMMIPGLERELTGMKIGAEKHVTIKPEDGYGKINPNAVREFPKEKIPPNALKVGAVLAASGPDGVPVPMTVRQIKEKTVVMDLNHPLAGKTLVFDIKVVDIQPPPPAPQPSKPGVTAKPSAPAKQPDPAQKK